jgi:hypothetical protein
MTEVNVGGDGTLAAIVWPAYAGAVQRNGDEPMFGLDYLRGQICWALTGADKIEGGTTINVPAGEWCWIIYCRDQFRPGFVTAQKLDHPLILDKPGTIDLHGITEDDVTPMAPDPVLHD